MPGPKDREAARARSRARHRAAGQAQIHERRRAVAVALFGAVGLLVVIAVSSLGGGGPSGRSRIARRADAKRLRPVPELPGGGKRIFPGRRVVAFYGTANTPVLGTLGSGTPVQAAARLRRQAAAYRRPGAPEVLPAFELIATVASSAPGPGQLYRNRRSLADVERYHRAIRRAGGLFIIDVQPGRAGFMSEVRRYAALLREPDVSLALDPEWKMGSGEIPGQTIGHTDAAEVNRVSAWLSDLVRRERLPQKLLVVHQFTDHMVRGRGTLRTRPGLALTIHVDGFGDRADKRTKYRQLAPRPPFFTGFKLFYTEDVGIFAPGDVLHLRPAPMLITYQ